MKKICKNCRSSCKHEEYSCHCRFLKAPVGNNGYCEHFDFKKPAPYPNTVKQQFWKKRNFIKYRIKGICPCHYTDKHLTLFEQDKIRQIEELRASLIQNWDKNNRLIKRAKADERSLT